MDLYERTRHTGTRTRERKKQTFLLYIGRNIKTRKKCKFLLDFISRLTYNKTITSNQKTKKSVPRYQRKNRLPHQKNEMNRKERGVSIITETLGKNKMEKNLEQIKKELQNSIEECNAKIAAWENVKRVTKKDGSDFSTLSKNFENAKIVTADYSIRNEKQIRVSGWTENRKFVDDYFSIVPCVKNVKFEVAPDRQIKESFLEPYFYMTVEEIVEAIENRIAMWKEYVESYEEQLRIADHFYILIENELEKISEILDAVSDKRNSKNLSLRYALEHKVKEHYFR